MGFKVIVLSTVVWYSLAGGGVTPRLVFVMLAAYNSVGSSLQLFFPLAVTYFSETQTTLRRIKVDIQ